MFQESEQELPRSILSHDCALQVHFFKFYNLYWWIILSDGVGRSGTYVLIDMVLNRMMKGSKEIDIAATLEHIRDQRSGKIFLLC